MYVCSLYVRMNEWMHLYRFLIHHRYSSDALSYIKRVETTIQKISIIYPLCPVTLLYIAVCQLNSSWLECQLNISCHLLYLNSIELTAKPWWDKNDFSWVSELENKSELIAEELRTMLRTEELFKGVIAWLYMYVCMYLCLCACLDGW